MTMIRFDQSPPTAAEMPLRDYLAAHVREPVPTDFEPVPWRPVEYPPPLPGMSQADADEVRQWDSDDGLHGVRADYWRACRDAYEARAAALRAAEVARLARWRYAFADAMLAARGQG